MQEHGDDGPRVNLEERSHDKEQLDVHDKEPVIDAERCELGEQRLLYGRSIDHGCTQSACQASAGSCLKDVFDVQTNDQCGQQANASGQNRAAG